MNWLTTLASTGTGKSPDAVAQILKFLVCCTTTEPQRD
jgi:hypothetical protein